MWLKPNVDMYRSSLTSNFSIILDYNEKFGIFGDKQAMLLY